MIVESAGEEVAHITRDVSERHHLGGQPQFAFGLLLGEQIDTFDERRVDVLQSVTQPLLEKLDASFQRLEPEVGLLDASFQRLEPEVGLLDASFQRLEPEVGLLRFVANFPEDGDDFGVHQRNHTSVA